MQFTNTNRWCCEGVGSALAIAVAIAVAVAVAGCTAPVPATKTLEVAQPPVQQQEAVAPTIRMPAAEAPAVPAPAPSQVTSEAVTQPVPRRRPVPRYPPDLAKTGLGGTVVVSFTLGAQGQPEDVRIESSSHPMFTREVKAVLPQWRYDPARDAAGRVVRQRMRVPFRFLQED